MKIFTKSVCLLLASLMILFSFVACGGTAESSTEAPKETQAPETQADENGRDAVKDGVPADLKYNGETVTFLTRAENVWQYDLGCEELLNDTLYDAIHYRNIDVETRLGVTIKTIPQSSAVADMATWNQTLSTSVLTNTGDYDGASIYASQSSMLAKDGIYLNFTELDTEWGNGYIDLGKPWWNQTLKDELTTYGALYFLAGDIMVSNIAYAYCLFFNKTLFDQKFPEAGTASLYKSVNDGTWTIEKMIDYVSQVWDDSNSNGVIDDGDVIGWGILGGNGDGNMDVWIYAMGLNITKTNAYGEPELSLIYDPNIVPAFELVQKLHNGNQGAYGTSGLTTKLADTTMANGNLLFDRTYLNGGSSMRDSEVVYGVLPLPKFNEEQENYRGTFANYASFLVLCSNLSEERAVMLSAVCELMAATSYKQVTPTYFSTVIQGQYSKDQPDAEMYDLVLKSLVADFGFAYSTKSIAEVGSLFRVVAANTDIQSKIDSNKTKYETALAELLAALEAIA